MMKYVVNCETGETEQVPLTAEEQAQRDADEAAADAATSANQQADADAAALKAQIVALAQSAVGQTLSALTTAQRSALTACMLWAAGGVTSDMKVRPLPEWLK